MKKYFKFIVAALIVLIFIGTFVFLYQKSQPKPLTYGEFTPKFTDTISGFGTFEIRERAERQGINPRTREPITIAASKSIVFKPGKALKDTL